MFSQASVILFMGACVVTGACVAKWCAWQSGACIVHGEGKVGVSMVGHAWHQGVCGRGACMAGGHTQQGACMAGACMGGSAWQWACMAGETVTAADGMYPTGMHSCLGLLSHDSNVFLWKFLDQENYY